MKYQLVLQFDEHLFNDFDEINELENSVISSLGKLGELDGHDIGSGEVNFFILTNNPWKSFEQILSIHGLNLYSDMKAAYRDLDGEKFTILYPAGVAEFYVS